MSDRTVFVDEKTLQDIANAIRLKTGSNDTFLPSEMPDAIKSMSSAAGLDLAYEIKPSDEPWVRPSDWPNIQQLPIDFANDEDVVYMLYDNRPSQYDNANNGWAGIRFAFELNTGSDQARIELDCGTIQNGEFIDENGSTSSIANPQNYSGKTGSTFTLYLNYSSVNADYVVIRAKTYGCHFIRFLFTYIPSATTGVNTIESLQNRCLERYGNLPWIRTLEGPNNTNLNVSDSYGCSYLQNDVVRIGKYSNTMSLCYTFSNCHSLRNVDFSGWSTSGWTINRLDNMFYNCWHLRHLDLSFWNTSNWTISNLNGMFAHCHSLISVNFSGWNTTNWAVVSLASMFENCYALKELDLSCWDTTNWNVRWFKSHVLSL